jgi:hypothetical protein
LLRIVVEEVETKSARSPATVEVGRNFGSSTDEVRKTGETATGFCVSDSIHVEPWWTLRTHSVGECCLFFQVVDSILFAEIESGHGRGLFD